MTIKDRKYYEYKGNDKFVQITPTKLKIDFSLSYKNLNSYYDLVYMIVDNQLYYEEDIVSNRDEFGSSGSRRYFYGLNDYIPNNTKYIPISIQDNKIYHTVLYDIEKNEFIDAFGEVDFSHIDNSKTNYDDIVYCAHFLKPSPEGGKIRFVSNRNHIDQFENYYLDLKDMTIKKMGFNDYHILDPAGPSYSGFISWIDEANVLYKGNFRMKNPSADYYYYDIIRKNIETGEEKILLQDIPNVRITSGMKSFIYSEGKYGCYMLHGKINLIDLMTGEIKSIYTSDTIEGFEADFSPDGNYILLDIKEKDHWENLLFDIQSMKYIKLNDVNASDEETNTVWVYDWIKNNYITGSILVDKYVYRIKK